LQLDPPIVKAQHDSSASVTAVAAFHACPRQYYLGHYLGMEGKSQSPDHVLVTGPRATDLGLEVHRMLAGEAQGSAEAVLLAQRFGSSELGERAARAHRREREFDFMLSIEDIILRGQIDLWFEEAGELVLVDYKTDREEGANENYQLQIRLYALALEQYAGRLPDRAVLFYLRSNRAVEVSVEPSELHQARDAVKAFLAAQHSLAFPLNVGSHCRRCPFLGNRCPAELSL
jgi:CRISPR/Cas system-associated exonuclease Cas4 (RecB family)